jgi:hypothetical protein
MSSHDYPVAGPDIGNEVFPLGSQANNIHVPMLVVMRTGTTDGIITGPRDASSQRSETVFQHPGENRENAIKAAA